MSKPIYGPQKGNLAKKLCRRHPSWIYEPFLQELLDAVFTEEGWVQYICNTLHWRSQQRSNDETTRDIATIIMAMRHSLLVWAVQQLFLVPQGTRSVNELSLIVLSYFFGGRKRVPRTIDHLKQQLWLDGAEKSSETLNKMLTRDKVAKDLDGRALYAERTGDETGKIDRAKDAAIHNRPERTHELNLEDDMLDLLNTSFGGGDYEPLSSLGEKLKEALLAQQDNPAVQRAVSLWEKGASSREIRSALSKKERQSLREKADRMLHGKPVRRRKVAILKLDGERLAAPVHKGARKRVGAQWFESDGIHWIADPNPIEELPAISDRVRKEGVKEQQERLAAVAAEMGVTPEVWQVYKEESRRDHPQHPIASGTIDPLTGRFKEKPGGSDHSENTTPKRNIQKETREELYFQNDMVNFEEGRFTELIPVQVPNRRNSEEVFKFLERLWNVVLGKSKPWTIDQTKRSTKDIAFTRSVEDEENEDDKESKGEEEKA